MTAAAFCLRLVDHAMGELAERVAAMPDVALQAEHDAIAGTGRSQAADMVRAVLDAEMHRRAVEARR